MNTISSEKTDENARDDFQEPKRLSLLVRVRGTDKRKIEKLGQKIGKALPMSKNEFIQILKDQDRTSLSGVYDDFFATARQSNSKGHVYLCE